jgi:hypothetical protein
MVLTREFKDTVRARAKRDPAFRAALLREGIELLKAGDLRVAQAILRDYLAAPCPPPSTPSR